MDETDPFEITEDNPEVRLGYGSHTNITFKGTEGTGYSRAEWDTLSDKQKDEVYNQTMWELVEIYELDDDQEDVY